jgi:hypothetical protein
MRGVVMCFLFHSSYHRDQSRRSAFGLAALGQDDFDDDDSDNPWLDSQDWDAADDAEDEGTFDPEPSSDDFDDDFDFDQFPDESECPPEELWNDADWE